MIELTAYQGHEVLNNWDWRLLSLKIGLDNSLANSEFRLTLKIEKHVI